MHLRHSTLLLVLCLTSSLALANSSPYIPLTLPKADDVVAFSNGLPPSSNLRTLIPRERILKFLSDGLNNLEVETWQKAEDADPNFQDISDGVFTDKSGKVYYWKLHNRRTLFIETEKGEMALLQLRG